MIVALFDSDGTLYTGQFGRGMMKYSSEHNRKFITVNIQHNMKFL